jgi:hypothetical protein
MTALIESLQTQLAAAKAKFDILLQQHVSQKQDWRNQVAAADLRVLRMKQLLAGVTKPNPPFVTWLKGNLPETDPGSKCRFIVCVQASHGPYLTFELLYLNRHVMPCGDACEPGDAEPVGEDSDEYYWTGWFYDHCPCCDGTAWKYDHPERIIAHAVTPRYNPCYKSYPPA